jgi:Domain of unknown function (DUF4020)/SIR2-like domain
VTTNYDQHLSTTLMAMGRTFAEETAPALPLGDDFTGVIYLHGRLGQPVRQLVVTDADFGQAYLRDAWATRFLERMFARYTVLFIGYSHSDSIVSYLGRGLRADSARFVLSDDPDSLRWRRLKIKPIAYPNPDHSHQALTNAIRGWASWAAMGLLDHRRRVAKLVAAAPSPIPEDMSYLEAVVADGGTVGFFTEYARGLEWLSWATSRREFQQLFGAEAESSDCLRALALWFAECYVMDGSLSDHAWSLVSQAGGTLSRELWQAVGQQLHRWSAVRPGWLARWLMLMVETAPRVSAQWLEFALMKVSWPDERATALLLFDHLAEPRAVLRPSFTRGGRIEIELRGDQFWLSEAWAKVFVPNLADAAGELIAIADRHLRRAHGLLTASGSARPGWDPASFSRSAIEPHAQDDMPGSADSLINAARDCLEYLLDNDCDKGRAYARLWAGAEAPLLRRLAVHGWTHRSDVDASAKLEWLRSQGWLFDHQLRHEVFALIAATIAEASAQVADALVADAAAGPTGAQHQRYEAYNAIVWIARHRPGLSSVRDALASMQASNPDFAERSHPDLMTRTDFSWAQPQLPMSVAELRRLISDDAAEAIAELESRTSPAEDPGWDDALSLISDTVRTWPDCGVAAFDLGGGTPRDIRSAIIQGWGATKVDDDTASMIIGKIRSASLSGVYRDVTRMLAGIGQAETEATQWHRLPAARLLATETWTHIPDDSVGTDAENWLGRAVNHPAGQLALFWVKAVAADWRDVGDNWTGLPDTTRQQLEAMLTGGTYKAAMAEIIFASQVHFLRAADTSWCLDHVLPLLDWAQPVRARRTWDGFLTWGRIDSQLLTAGLRDQYLQAAARMELFPGELSRMLSLHLATVALDFPDAATIAWARRLTVRTDVAVRVAWMHQIEWQLSAMPAGAVEQHWRDWMRQYWDDRLASIPKQLSFEEASAMASWVVYLTDSFEEGANLASSKSAGITEHSRILHELTNDRIAGEPVPAAKLLAHLLRGTDQPFYGCHELQRITQALDNRAEPADLTAIREQALRLGCTGAADW